MLKERTGPEAMKSGNFTAADSFPLRKDFLLAAFGPFDEVDGSERDVFTMYKRPPLPVTARRFTWPAAQKMPCIRKWPRSVTS